jgi:vacuolar protein sorting-associated protein 52
MACIGGLFSSGKPSIRDKTNVFALGERIETLRAHDAGVILVHIAEDEGVVSVMLIGLFG